MTKDAGFSITLVSRQEHPPLLPFLLLSAVLAGCATTPETPVTTSLMICTRPIFVPGSETKEVQEKGGIQISVTPVSFSCVPDSVVTVSKAEPTFWDFYRRPRNPDLTNVRARFIERVTTPVFKVMPDRLRFTIRLNNKLERVFRGAGTVVQFSVRGRLQSIHQNDYAVLTNAIVPPRDEKQVEIYGPTLGTLRAGDTIGVLLYDVVTKTDPAGNPTEKQNFEWFFDYKEEVREESGTVDKWRGWERY